MSVIRTCAKDMQSRTQMVAQMLNGALDMIAEEAHAEGWDMREIPAGYAMGLCMFCQNQLKMNEDEVVGMIRNLEIPGGWKTYQRDLSGLVAPNGRPLAKVGE